MTFTLQSVVDLFDPLPAAGREKLKDDICQPAASP